MSFSLSSVAGPSLFDPALSAFGDANPGAALPAANAGPLAAAGESRPAPILDRLVNSAEGHRQLSLSLSRLNRLQELVQRQHPALLSALECRFKRYHGLIYRLNDLLQHGPSATHLQAVRRGINQVNLTTWALQQLLDQLPDPRIVPLLQSMAERVASVGAWIARFKSATTNTLGAHPALSGLDQLLSNMERASTVDACEDALNQLDSRLRSLHSAYSTLSGRPAAARMTGQGQGQGQGLAPPGSRQALSTGASWAPGRAALGARLTGGVPSRPRPAWAGTGGASTSGGLVHFLSPSGAPQQAASLPEWLAPDAKRSRLDVHAPPDTASTVTDTFFSPSEPRFQQSGFHPWPLNAPPHAGGHSASRPAETVPVDPADWITHAWRTSGPQGDPNPGND